MVLMPKTVYLDKLNELLSDNNTHIEIRTVGISSMQTNLNLIISSWERLGNFNRTVAKN